MQHSRTRHAGNLGSDAHLPIPAYSPAFSNTSQRSFSGNGSFPPSPAVTPRNGSPPLSDIGADSFLLEQQPLFPEAGPPRRGVVFQDNRYDSVASFTALGGQQQEKALPNEKAIRGVNASSRTRKSSKRKWFIAAGVLAVLAIALVAAVVAVKLAKHDKLSASDSGNEQDAQHSLTSTGTGSSTGTSSVSILSATNTITAVVTATPTITGNWPQGWTQDMVFPTGYAGTGKNGLIGSSSRASASTSGGQYAQLLAFGSSYSDNAHPRQLPKYASSLSPPGYYENRWR
jgi:hypothetical protein